MTVNLCNPALPSRFDRTITGSPEFFSGVVHADIVPLVFLHPRNRRQFSMSFRRLPFAGLPLVYGRSVSTISGQFSFVFSKYSINSLVYWVTYVHNVVYSFYRSMIYCYINSTQRCAGSIVIDIIPTNGADKRKFFPFAPYFPVTNVIKRYFYPYFPAIIGIKGYSFPYFPYLSGIMKIKTALYSLFSRLDWHKTVVFPCLGEIYEGIRSLSWEIPVT